MGDLTRPRFLAVDDESLAKQFYCRILRKYGDPTVVYTIAQAKEALSGDASWDAFLFDLRLPDGTGLEVLDYARRRFPQTPAVVISGYLEGWVVNRAYDLSAGVLSKPFEAARLHSWIERALGGLRAATGERQPPALRSRIRTLRELRARRPADALTRHRLGAIVAELKGDPKRYGEGAVTVAALAVGEDEVTLYRHARVAERWSAAEIEALLSQPMCNGRRLSWSHLVSLATVHDDDGRARLLQRTVDESLTVRQLDELLEQAESMAPY